MEHLAIYSARAVAEVTSVDPPADGREPVACVPERVLVPRTPGRLLPVDGRPQRQRDELDLMVDQLFGESTNERPGRFDAVLVILGVALLVWWLIADQATGTLFLGSAMLLLGLVLPLRSVRQRLRRRRAVRAMDALRVREDVLYVADPTVLDLTTSYAELVAASELPGLSDGRGALAAGHQAVAEVTSLLRGRSPIVPAEVEYVRKRTDAIHSLTVQLKRSHEASLAAKRHRLGDEEQEHQLRASALATARGELDGVDPADSLDQLESLAQRLRHEAP